MFQSPFRSFDALPPADYYPIAVADLNHDGLADVVSAPHGSSALGLRVWLSSPDFGSTGPTYFVGLGGGRAGGRSIVFADMNGDGIPDAVVGGDVWGFYPGNGDGTFGPFRNNADDGEIGAVVAVDLNGDGILDMVGTSDGFTSSGPVVTRLGRGGGVMDSATFSFVFPRPSGLATGLAVVDVNGDGIPDAIISSPQSSLCWLLIGNTGGYFYPSTVLGPGGRNVYAGDFNHDGHVDFVSGRNVYLGRGDGSFDPGQTLGAEVQGIADFDGDGNSDLILLHDASVEIMGGRGDGTFVSRGEFPCGRHPWFVATGDMNGDGKLDLVVSLAPLYGGAPAFSVLIGDGHGGLGTLPMVSTGSNPRKVLAADITGDGIPDLITAERGVRRVAMRPGLGGMSFGGRSEFEAAPGLTTAMLADLNGDGLPDLVTASDSATTVGTFMGAPGGGFGARRDFAAGGSSVALASGDFNGDHKTDIATANGADGTSSLLLGDGIGGLGPALTTGTNIHADAIAVADQDRDGRLDVIVGGFGSWPGDGRITILHGDGTGAFGSNAYWYVGRPVAALAVADRDRDGLPDLAIAQRDSSGNVYGTLTNYLGNGGGQHLPVGAMPTDVLLADFDGDGNLDIAVACYGTNAVSVFRGHADGTFSDRVDYGVADGPVSLAAADLDGDGAPELLVACDRSNVVTILHNLSGSLPTPTLVSLVDSHADANGVRLTWDAGGLPGLRATVERRTTSMLWEPRADLAADGTGRLSFTDAQVEAGQAYFYRLTWLDQGVARHSGETQVIVPARADLALAGARPNPADARLQVAFSLPDAAPATLELHDLAGRALVRREVGALGAGEHTLALGEGLALRPGLYWIRLTRGARSFTARAALVR